MGRLAGRRAGMIRGAVLLACAGKSGEYAATGAGYGAVALAAGGLVSALVFGGNAGEAESALQDAMVELQEIRAEHDLPRICVA